MSPAPAWTQRLLGRKEKATMVVEEFVAPLDTIIELDAIGTAVLYDRFGDAEDQIRRYVDTRVARYRSAGLRA